MIEFSFSRRSSIGFLLDAVPVLNLLILKNIPFSTSPTGIVCDNKFFCSFCKKSVFSMVLFCCLLVILVRKEELPLFKVRFLIVDFVASESLIYGTFSEFLFSSKKF